MQLHILKTMANGDESRFRRGSPHQDAIEAILAERAELLDGVQEARAFIYEHLGSGWAVGDMLEALSRKANGGP